jgi:FkbM family methyltransferase
MKRAAQWAVAAGVALPGVRGLVRAAAGGGLLPKAAWVRAPVVGRFAFAGPTGVPLWYDPGFMDQLGRTLFYRGLREWEPELVRALPALAAGAAGVADVGAHTGLFSLLALTAAPAAVGVAAEPVVGNAALVAGNLRANRLDGRCMVVPAAVSAVAGRVPFDPGCVEVPMQAAVTPGAGAAFGHHVPSVTLDQLAGWMPRLDLVKIDVEGHEADVLRGGLATLCRDTPHVIVECLPGSGVEAVMPDLEAAGYRRFRLTPDGAEPVAIIAPRAEDRSFNYLLTARPAVVGG